MVKLKLKLNLVEGEPLTKDEMRKICGGAGSDMYGSGDLGSSGNSGSGSTPYCCYGINATHNICADTPRTAEIFAGPDGYWTCNTDMAYAKCSSRVYSCRIKYV